jgi:surface antigen
MSAAKVVAAMVVAAIASLAGTSAAHAEAGGYPHWNMPCSHAPYATTGACANYDWGPVHDGSASTTYSSRGYGYRNCTDWVAWRLQQLGLPDSKTRGLGNGKDWVNAASRGIIVDSTPAPGDAAVRTGGTYGHVAFVEAVNGNNITVSQYNNGAVGEYSTQTGTPAALNFQKFLHFGANPNPPATPIPAGRRPVADFNGDGRTDLGLYNPSDGRWSIRDTGGYIDNHVTHGGPGWVPVPGDFNGDGRTDLGLYNPSDGRWSIRDTGGYSDNHVTHGGPAWVPAHIGACHHTHTC